MTERPLAPIVPKRGRGRPPKHGLYSKYQLMPLTDDKYKQIIEFMTGQRMMVAPSDELFINLLARLLAQIELMGRYLSEAGIFQENADGTSRGIPNPMVSHYLSYIAKASELCSKLGLTAESRIRLSHHIAQVDDLASRIQRAKQQ